MTDTAKEIRIKATQNVLSYEDKLVECTGILKYVLSVARTIEETAID